MQEYDLQTPRNKERSMAVRLESFGGPEVLKLQGVLAPQAGAGQIRVRVTAAGLHQAVEVDSCEGNLLPGYAGIRKHLLDHPVEPPRSLDYLFEQFAAASMLGEIDAPPETMASSSSAGHGKNEHSEWRSRFQKRVIMSGKIFAGS